MAGGLGPSWSMPAAWAFPDRVVSPCGRGAFRLRPPGHSWGSAGSFLCSCIHQSSPAEARPPPSALGRQPAPWAPPAGPSHAAACPLWPFPPPGSAWASCSPRSAAPCQQQLLPRALWPAGPSGLPRLPALPSLLLLGSEERQAVSACALPPHAEPPQAPSVRCLLLASVSLRAFILLGF